MGKIDVLDLDVSIAKYIYKGITSYILHNESAVFPTAPNYDFFENVSKNATLEERVKEWHATLRNVAEKFKTLSKRREVNCTDDEIADAFSSLKKVYKYLWI